MSKSEDICNPSNFKRCYDEHAEDLRNYIYYKSGSTTFAEDTIQESFLRLWKHCAKVPYQKSKSFLFTTATNLFRDMVKHRKVKLKFAEKPVQSSTNQDPEFLLQEKEFEAKLNLALNELPEEQRTTFLMNRIDKLKYREIAEILGVSQKTVEKRMHKALLVLRKKIGNI